MPKFTLKEACVHMIKILTVGVFDYFHYGHLCLFKQAKALATDAYLIVAVQATEYIKKTKPDTTIFYSTAVRKELVSALKIVDCVITYTDVASLVKDVDFDIFAVGEDQNHQGFQKAIEYCKSIGKQVIRLKRTKNISSSVLKTIAKGN